MKTAAATMIDEVLLPFETLGCRGQQEQGAIICTLTLTLTPTAAALSRRNTVLPPALDSGESEDSDELFVILKNRE
jgi:hypothetical protein